MNAFFKTISADRIILFTTVCAALLVLLHLVLFAVTFRNLPPFLSLFNQMPWGDDRVGTRAQMAIPVLLTVATVVINTMLVRSFYEALPLVARIVSATSLLVALLGFLFTLRTVLLVT